MSAELDSRGMDELDLALIDALHVNPRATAEQLGPVLQVSPVTVNRRWRSLVDNGQAWISSVPGPAMPLAGGLFEAECQPGQAAPVAAALAAVPSVVSVGLISGSMDVYCLLATAETDTLRALIADTLPVIPGLARTRSSLMTRLYSAPNWRLGAIDNTQQRALQPGHDQHAGIRRFDAFDRDLFLAFQIDGRRTYRAVAHELGRTEQTVNRRVTALVRDGTLAFRTDFVRAMGGWKVQVMLRLHAQPLAVPHACKYLQQQPETRVCATVTGEANIICTVMLHRIEDLDQFLTRATIAVAPLHVLDHHVVLSTIKTWGRILDNAGRSTGVVPVDLWPQPPKVS